MVGDSGAEIKRLAEVVGNPPGFENPTGLGWPFLLRHRPSLIALIHLPALQELLPLCTTRTLSSRYAFLPRGHPCLEEVIAVHRAGWRRPRSCWPCSCPRAVSRTTPSSA